LFPNGADTFIGERGVTLSGGQRARVALARAVYFDADVFILDDPLSAVDTKVARHIFEECIQGVLKNKTVLLVTHQLQFVKYSDQIIALEKGRIAEHGSFLTILKSQTSFAETLREFTTGVSEEVDDHVKEKAEEEESADTNEVSTKPTGFGNEESAKGSVPLKTYYRYFRSGSSLGLTLTLLFAMTVGQALLVSSDFWLAHFSNQSAANQRDPIYVYVFISLALATFVVAMVRAYMFFLVCLRASKQSFQEMLHSVFRSPMSFFQINPHGRVMNRFSKDINMMDETLPQVFFDLVQCLFILFGIVVVTCVVLPYLLLLYPLLAYFFYKLRNYYMATSRQVKRIEAVTRSPVYSCIPSTLEGLSIIRAFGAEERIKKVFFHDQDENTRMFFAFLSSGRWLGMRLDFLVAVLLTIILFVCVPLRALLNISPSLIGLLLSYMFQMIGTLQWAVRQSSEVENLMVSTERVLEYTSIPSEAAEETEVNPPKDWPHQGELSVENLSLTYPNLQNLQENPPVLKNLTIHFEPGTKVGIVGRTGSGKSTFLQALFRIVEPTTNSIKLDGIYTSSLGLRDLRSRISIIPQEPFCFKGTLRFNLDPFDQYDAEKLWSVLAAVELKPLVEGMPDKLDSPVYENGSNWSVGERQLICLARAILRNSKLIVMDEATSSVDMHTDQLIQKAIRTSDGLFAQSTVLTIAHRLNTVIDYDKIMVLDNGVIVEYGAPYELLQKSISEPDAWFSRMVEEMGPEARENLTNIARKKHLQIA
jgi:ATP-binding cassette subfamily C (CFTR/MRP) protein 4